MKRSAPVIIRIGRRTHITTPNAADKRYWSVAECCERLGGISRDTLDRYRRAGLPSISIPEGNKILFDPSSVAAWLGDRESA